MGRKPSLFSRWERLVIGTVLLLDCLVLGLVSSGRLPYPFLKGIAGVILAAIGLYTFRKVRKRPEGPSE